jgi:type I restriction enzyme M protein
MDNKSIFEKNINNAINQGFLRLSEDNKKIIYLNLGTNKEQKSYNIKDPEEKVRASFFAELVLHYNYPTELINLEIVTPHRVPKLYTDIVVFKDKENKQPLIAIEVKKDGITQAEENQAIEQTHSYGGILKSSFCMLVSGTTKIAYDLRESKTFERTKNKIADIPKFKEKEPPKYTYIKKKHDLEQLNKEDLIKILGSCHDIIWQGGKLAPTQAFDEVSKLLFCKIKDEKDTLNNKIYHFQIGTNETIKEISDRVKQIYERARKEDEEVFKEDIKLNDNIIYAVVEKIQNINFVDTDLDTKGVAFETFMEDFFKGKMGQFFTPREVINFCVEMLDIKNTDKVLDTSCGSGGFLLASLDKVRKWAEQSFDEIRAYQKWHDFAKDNLFGIEINEQIARVCKMNMIIHDDGHTNVISTDGLENFKNYNTKFQKEKFDKILTNPPFGATVKSAEKEKGFLEKFELGKNKKNQKTEILFIERCWEFLKPNGSMAIVLPDGILTNSSLQYVRDFIMSKFKINAVVSIPSFAFSHFGAGVKSSLVFLRKKTNNEKLGHYPIFMAIAKRIGYDATGRKDKVNDFETILKQYKEFKNK